MAGGTGPCAVSDAAWRQWSTQIPLDVRTIVNPFRHSRWQMLRLAARCGKAALDLMATDPVVAWLLGNREKTSHPSRVANRLLRQRSPMAVLQWAGFEPTHDAATIIRKLPAGELNATSVQHLRDVLGSEPQVREWVHVLPRLTEDVLAVLADARTRRLCTLDLLIDLVERDPAAANLLGRIARLIGTWCGPAPVFRSGSELRAWIDATVASRRAAGEQATLRERAGLRRILGTSSIERLGDGHTQLNSACTQCTRASDRCSVIAVVELEGVVDGDHLRCEESHCNDR